MLVGVVMVTVVPVGTVHPAVIYIVDHLTREMITLLLLVQEVLQDIAREVTAVRNRYRGVTAVEDRC